MWTPLLTIPMNGGTQSQKMFALRRISRFITCSPKTSSLTTWPTYLNKTCYRMIPISQSDTHRLKNFLGSLVARTTNSKTFTVTSVPRHSYTEMRYSPAIVIGGPEADHFSNPGSHRTCDVIPCSTCFEYSGLLLTG